MIVTIKCYNKIDFTIKFIVNDCYNKMLQKNRFYYKMHCK